MAVSVRFAKVELTKAGGALRAKCGEAWPASSDAGRPRERAAERANTILNYWPKFKSSGATKSRYLCEDARGAGDVGHF